MSCKDCPYCWREEDESYPTCKFEAKCADDIPPCEYEEEEEE